MVLPFVRELFADVEKVPGFARAASFLKSGAGRMSVSGLTPTAKALYVTLLAHAAQRPLIVLAADNRAGEALAPLVRSFAEMTGAVSPDAVLLLPAYDGLPFDHLSPHPEIQETRAAALWNIATGGAAIVIAPAAAAAQKMRPAEFYADLARVIRRGESFEVDALAAHLRVVGYAEVDVVEMPGQFALRGGILDVYSPEAERPVRIEFFGDEVESIRRFDPASQRSQNPTDDAVLLPLTENPVREEILAAIHGRLSGQRVSGAEATVQEAIAASGVSVFPGWEFYAGVAGAEHSLLELIPRAAVLVDEPAAVDAELDRWWEKVASAHERSGVGRLVGPEDLYFAPATLEAQVAERTGGTLEHLGIETGNDGHLLHLSLLSQPTPRF